MKRSSGKLLLFISAGLAAFAVLLPLIVQAASGTIVTWTGIGSRRNTVEVKIESPSVGAAANVLPGTANANDLGNSTYYWNEVYAQNVAFGVAVTTTSSPARAGLIGVNASNTLYISTGTGAGAWVVVGSQS